MRALLRRRPAERWAEDRGRWVGRKSGRDLARRTADAQPVCEVVPGGPGTPAGLAGGVAQAQRPRGLPGAEPRQCPQQRGDQRHRDERGEAHEGRGDVAASVAGGLRRLDDRRVLGRARGRAGGGCGRRGLAGLGGGGRRRRARGRGGGGPAVVAPGGGAGGVAAGVVVAGAGGAAAAALRLAQSFLARASIAARSASGKSGAYCSMSGGTSFLAFASSCAEYLQGSICPSDLKSLKIVSKASAYAFGATTASAATM